MTGAGMRANLPAMRALLIPSALAAAFIATPAAAESGCAAPAAADSTPLIPIEPEATAEPAPLAPLAPDSPWRARFEAAADALLPALRSGEWQPMLGGRWLGEADRQAAAALLTDTCAAFAPLLASGQPLERRILGWTIPARYSAAERAEIAARPEAEALVCWSAAGEGVWPATAAEADNRAGRPYACARIAYSMRGGVPSWRAFVERG